MNIIINYFEAVLQSWLFLNLQLQYDNSKISKDITFSYTVEPREEKNLPLHITLDRPSDSQRRKILKSGRDIITTRVSPFSSSLNFVSEILGPGKPLSLLDSSHRGFFPLTEPRGDKSVSELCLKKEAAEMEPEWKTRIENYLMTQTFLPWVSIFVVLVEALMHWYFGRCEAGVSVDNTVVLLVLVVVNMLC